MPLASPADPPPIETDAPSDSAAKPTYLQAKGTSGNTWMYFLIIPIVAVLVFVAAGLLFMCRDRGVTTIGPWKTGLSGQLQKAFVTGEF